MPPTLRAAAYELDFDDLYARMWRLAAADRGDGTRLFKPSHRDALKWIIADLAGTPAERQVTKPENNAIRSQAHRVLLEEGWAERLNGTSFRLLRPPPLDWPTIEWVKEPIDRESELPNGTPIRMRHFLDCPHWYRDGSRLLGEPPRLATDEEMRALPSCLTCVAQAESASNPKRGPRLATDSLGLDSLPETRQAPWATTAGTDGVALLAFRREQRFLRQHLLDGQSEAPCAICGRVLPSQVLVAAHIVPRSGLNQAQRLDFTSAAMLACLFGCDALFERGFIAVDASGRLVAHCESDNEALRAKVSELVGRRVAAFNSATAPRFASHRELHRV